MTDEVGIVTGDLTVVTDIREGQAVVQVAYTGAEESYTVTGGPLVIAGGDDGACVHAAMVRAVQQGLPDGLAGFDLT
ncbi:hypothetical protein OG589_11175 [Sphaerisporangium sp. NBC_01403]|uniref:hypothetical protein n=1 Tax=Sphaerisporangium sp. NBC_01403 TaxID=2903599 RepID=UPI003243B995